MLRKSWKVVALALVVAAGVMFVSVGGAVAQTTKPTYTPPTVPAPPPPTSEKRCSKITFRCETKTLPISNPDQYSTYTCTDDSECRVLKCEGLSCVYRYKNPSDIPQCVDDNSCSKLVCVVLPGQTPGKEVGTCTRVPKSDPNNIECIHEGQTAECNNTQCVESSGSFSCKESPITSNEENVRECEQGDPCSRKKCVGRLCNTVVGSKYEPGEIECTGTPGCFHKGCVKRGDKTMCEIVDGPGTDAKCVVGKECPKTDPSPTPT